MSRYDELIGVLRSLLTEQFAPKPRYIRAVLGDGRGNVVVPGNPDRSYARFTRDSTTYFEIFNRNVNPVNDWPILIGELPWQPGLTQVVDTDWSVFEQSGWGDDLGNTSPHAPTHVRRDGSIGSDPLDVYLPMLAPARAYTTVAAPSTVYVNALEYGTTGTFWQGLPGIDLQPLMDATVTGTMRFAGVYIDTATNILGAVTGSTTVHTSAFDPPRVSFPASGAIPVARVKLYGGQAVLSEVNDFRDARRLFTTVGSGGGGAPSGPAGGDLDGTYPNPTVDGLRGYGLANVAPGEGQVLMFSGSAWRPVVLDTGGLDINGLTAETSIADDDELAIYDITAAANRKMSRANYLDGISRASENLLYHSLTHNIWQEGTSFLDIADDTYVADLWNVLHNASTPNRPDVDQQAAGGTSTYTIALRMQAKAASTRMGVVQFLEAEDTRPLRGQTVSLSFDAWGSAGVTNIRATVIAWIGTADSPTSDVVGTWGTNPTLATNWGYSFTPSSSIAITTSQARYAVENITVTSSANNLAVFLWTPDAQANGDFLYIANVKLEVGPSATLFVPKPMLEEQHRVYRFYFTRAGAGGHPFAFGGTASTSILRGFIPLPVTMRANPAVTATCNIRSNGTAVTVETIDGIAVRTQGVEANFTDTGAGLTANHAGVVYLTSGSLVLDARL